MKTVWYRKAAPEVLKQLSTDAALGLSKSTAQHLLERFGPNELVDKGNRFSMGLFSNRLMVFALMITAALQIVVVSLPLANRIFGTVPMPGADWALGMGLALIVLIGAEGWKWRLRKRRHLSAGKRHSLPGSKPVDIKP